ncbi:TetR/AcrR family transcriptional regulator [Streptomyces sp. CRN 30]|uniref:TetR/AcrR family transcriptional regulator n=1 Tax=Streptomyces sp. CRN 30 TaxID=3075613 RepID=UPI002A80B395|nr:TetR/AcrR family transcriptional regulator [Streptomyces sp. CRN 30]
MSPDRQGIAPRKQPRQVRAELTRDRILDAAAHVFGEYGYAAGTTNRIAERARVSIGSLYQYYPNKDAILAELLTRHLDRGQASVERLLTEGLPDSLEDILRRFVRASAENHQDDPQLLRVMVEQGPRSAELLERVTVFQRERIAYALELLRTHPEVRVADTVVAARILVATVEILIHTMVAAPDPVDVTRLEDEIVAMLFRYLTGASGASLATGATATTGATGATGAGSG